MIDNALGKSQFMNNLCRRSFFLFRRLMACNFSTYRERIENLQPFLLTFCLRKLILISDIDKQDSHPGVFASASYSSTEMLMLYKEMLRKDVDDIYR
jgi:hypothetical protein